MGQPGMVISGIAATAGAIMYWAMTAQSQTQNGGFRLSTVGVILMIAGAVGFLVSLMVFAASRRSLATPASTIVRTTKNAVGDTTELHEQRN